MIEELINLKRVIRKKESKEKVREAYQEYTNAYQEMEKDVADKMRYKEITEKYWTYMYFSGGKKGNVYTNERRL